MRRLDCDLLVVGSGPAGLGAAYRAKQEGIQDVVIVERNDELGGILTQCIHNGFGLRIFGDDLTGPEYAYRWIERVHDAQIQVLSNTMVLSVNGQRRVVAVNAEMGLIEIVPRAIMLAMGCRERPRGALAIPGTRPAGVYSAGTAQRLVNMQGYMPGSSFVILGSGDIGMIMARRLTIEGAHVERMLEVLPYVSGLRRNLVQCLHDYDVPLELCSTVTEVRGRRRVEAIVKQEVDDDWRPIPGTEEVVPCDTLLLSVGLIPENELSRMAGVALEPITGGPTVDERFATSVPGIFAAGNVVHVYDLVDDVTESAERAGACVADYIRNGSPAYTHSVRPRAGENVRHIVPQIVHPEFLEERAVTLHLRVREPIERAVRIEARADGETIVSRRLRYVRPSEMVSLRLGPDLVRPLMKTKELSVDVVD